MRTSDPMNHLGSILYHSEPLGPLFPKPVQRLVPPGQVRPPQCGAPPRSILLNPGKTEVFLVLPPTAHLQFLGWDFFAVSFRKPALGYQKKKMSNSGLILDSKEGFTHIKECQLGQSKLDSPLVVDTRRHVISFFCKFKQSRASEAQHTDFSISISKIMQAYFEFFNENKKLILKFQNCWPSLHYFFL